MSFTEEPALIIAGVGAIFEALLIVLVAFGLPITTDQKVALTSFGTVVITVLTGIVTRSQVTPTAKVAALVPPVS
jgi:hypothetical protein